MEIERPTQNSARASRAYPVGSARLLAAVRRAAGGLPRWRVEPEDGDVVRAVRTTRLLRFKDDVTARVSPEPGGSRVELASVSRVGISDLGQNPRNLEELARALDHEVRP